MAKILVVDDEQEALDLVQSVLAREHEVVTAKNWIQAIDYVVKGEFDLILMDINMPGLKGDELSQIITKRIGHKKALNIVLFSSMPEAELRQRAKDVNAKGYIAKTFNKDVLHVRINRFLKGLQQA